MVECSRVCRCLLFATRSDFNPSTVKIHPLSRQSTMIVHVYYCNNVKQKNFRIVEIAILSGMVKLISCPEVRALD